MKSFFEMEAVLRFLSVALLLSACSVFGFPSRPLNERSKELAWQAWLLVDDQNQNKQNEPDTLMRRRITPKSVFIAPTFSPDKLPACAEGYRSDAMGRCIQIIKLDQAAHLDFLLQKLNQKYGNFGDFDDTQDENASTPGPFLVNLPLEDIEKNNESQYEEDAEDSDTNPDIAIIVAPTNQGFDLINDGKVKRTEGQDDIGTFGNIIKNKTASASEDDRTTTTEEVTTQISTTFDVTQTTILDSSSTTSFLDETSSTSHWANEPVDTESTASVTASTLPIAADDTTTTEVLSALFFLNSKNASETPSSGGFNLANRIKFDEEQQPQYDAGVSAASTATMLPNLEDSNKRIIFTDPLRSSSTHQENKQSHQRHTPSLVRFPLDETANPSDQMPHLSHLPVPQKLFPDNAESVVQYAGFGQQIVDAHDHQLFTAVNKVQTHNDHELLAAAHNHNINNNNHHQQHQVIHKHHEDEAPSIFGNGGGNNKKTGSPQPQAYVFSHRNRDKSFWNLPTDWGDINPSKPIVLKFSNRSNAFAAAAAVAAANESLQPKTSSEGIYREVPPEDLTYIFGVKRRPRRNNGHITTATTR